MKIHTKRLGYITLSFPDFKYTDHRRKFGLMLSADGHLYSSTLLMGNRYSNYEKDLARIRYERYGHGFDMKLVGPQLKYLK